MRKLVCWLVILSGAWALYRGVANLARLKARPSGDIADIYMGWFSLGQIFFGVILLVAGAAILVALARRVVQNKDDQNH